MIKVETSGDFKNLDRFLNRMQRQNAMPILRAIAAEGLEALKNATPVRTGLTASSWYSEVTYKGGRYNIIWHNSNAPGGVPVAILIQSGHGTGTGGYVQGLDYINPAVQPLFKELANKLWMEVTRA